MSTQLKLRRGTTAQHSTFTGAEGEVTVDTTKDTLVVHDGTTAGGKPVLTEVNPSYTGTLTGGTGVVNLGSGQVYKDASGNVGIGTSSPVTKFAVNGTAVAGAFGTGYSISTRIGQSGDGASNADVDMRRWSGGGTNHGTSRIATNDSAAMLFYTDAKTTDTFATTERARIDSSGNVGIGTTTPGFSGWGKAVRVQGVGNAASEVTDGTVTTTMYSSAGSVGSIGTQTNHPLLLETNGTERARIDSSGNLGVGTTTVGAANSNSLSLRTSGGGGTIFINHINGTANGIGYAGFAYNGSAIGNILQSGTTAVSYNTTSDYRLKENIAPMTGALARVAALKPCTYTWKSAPNETGEGFIAHELAEVCPQAATGEKDAVDADGNPQYQGIDTSFLVATLTAAIQEQQTLITALTARIDILEQGGV